jgi:YegS/Rv2252/BmrU family lipid kinase
MRVAVLLNPASGPKREGAAESEIQAAFEALGVRPDIILLSREVNFKKEMSDRVKAGFDAIVASGGDGTVSLAGSAVAGSSTALGVLPTGTLNHFAKDMGLPADVETAAKVVVEGHHTCVDVAEVNGRVFLNNSSIGFYPTLVMEREKRIQRGVSKTLALLPAAIAAMWQFPNTTVRVATDETGLVTKTPFVFVGNNQYAFSGLQAGSRERLSDGILQLCAVSTTSRMTLVKSIALAIAGKIDSAPALITLDAKWAKIETLRHHVNVALDGEVVRLSSPLVYTIRPGALKVLVPATPAEEAK